MDAGATEADVPFPRAGTSRLEATAATSKADRRRLFRQLERVTRKPHTASGSCPTNKIVAKTASKSAGAERKEDVF